MSKPLRIWLIVDIIILFIMGVFMAIVTQKYGILSDISKNSVGLFFASSGNLLIPLLWFVIKEIWSWDTEMIYYFVSYFFTDNDGSGYGRCRVLREKPIRDIEDVFNIEKDIKAEGNSDSITVINWKKFEED